MIVRVRMNWMKYQIEKTTKYHKYKATKININIENWMIRKRNVACHIQQQQKHYELVIHFFTNSYPLPST